MQANKDDPTTSQTEGSNDTSLEVSESSAGADNIAGLKEDAQRLAELGGAGGE